MAYVYFADHVRIVSVRIELVYESPSWFKHGQGFQPSSPEERGIYIYIYLFKSCLHYYSLSPAAAASCRWRITQKNSKSGMINDVLSIITYYSMRSRVAV